MTHDERLRYPLGRFRAPDTVTAADRRRWIGDLAALPVLLRAALHGLTESQLDTPYRRGGWTLRQLAHHVPDSHMHAYARVKLALTEDAPTIKPYDEARWAQLPDTRDAPVEVSLALLDALHRRWVTLLSALSPSDFARTYVHPEQGRAVPLDEALANYAWHGRHHTAHATELRARKGW